jgi:hypothetical protein
VLRGRPGSVRMFMAWDLLGWCARFRAGCQVASARMMLLGPPKREMPVG